MDFKKKLKSRLYIAIIYTMIGLLMIIGSFIIKNDNEFISSFGLVVTVIGIVRIRNYFLITKSDENVRKQEIIETDERNIMLVNKARSAAFILYIIILGIAVIVLSFMSMHEAAKWISYAVCLLIIIYWICYWIYRKKS